jgi:hypothetical protein
MSPNRRRRRRDLWSDDDYVLTNWKLRSAYVLFAALLGLWVGIVCQSPLLLSVLVAVAVALLRIWREVRRHEPRD